MPIKYILGSNDKIDFGAVVAKNAAGKAGQVLKVKSSEDGLEYGTFDFLSLLDTPDSFSGQGDKLVGINNGETALEFNKLQLRHLATESFFDRKKLMPRWMFERNATPSAPDYDLTLSLSGGATDYPNALVFDGTWLYAGIYSSPGKVLRINPKTLTIETTLTLNTGENRVWCLLLANGFLYAGLQPTTDGSAEAKIIKINPSTMTRVSDVTLTSTLQVNAMTYDGTNIYASTTLISSGYGKIWKLNPSDLSVVSSLTLGTDIQPWNILWLDGFLYVPMYISPGKVHKINASTMAIDTTITLASGENVPVGLTTDGTYIYVGLDTDPGRVLKLNPKDMTYTTYKLENDEGLASYLAFDGEYLWLATDTTPGHLLRFEPKTMTSIRLDLATGLNHPYSIAIGEKAIYLGLNLNPNPGKVVKVGQGTFNISHLRQYLRIEGDSTVHTEGIFLVRDLSASPGGQAAFTVNDKNNNWLYQLDNLGGGAMKNTFHWGMASSSAYGELSGENQLGAGKIGIQALGSSSNIHVILWPKGTSGYVGVKTLSPAFPLHVSGRLAYGVPTTAPTDGNLGNSELSAWLDETNGNLVFRIKKSDGTLVTASVAYA